MEYTLGRVGIVARGAYDSTQTYEALDMVSYQNSSFMAMETVQGVAPSANSTSWMLIAAQGPVGIGDMAKSVYDLNNDGIVDHAALADQAAALTATATVDMARVNGLAGALNGKAGADHTHQSYEDRLDDLEDLVNGVGTLLAAI